MDAQGLRKLRDEVAMPRMDRLLEDTVAAEGALYIESLELHFPDGNNCGHETLIKATGLTCRNGMAEVYDYSELDVEPAEFLAEHAEAVFLSDGRLVVEDELFEMTLTTRLGNLDRCKQLFFQMENLPKANLELFYPLEYIKLQKMLAEQEAARPKPCNPGKAKIAVPKEAREHLLADGRYEVGPGAYITNVSGGFELWLAWNETPIAFVGSEDSEDFRTVDVDIADIGKAETARVTVWPNAHYPNFGFTFDVYRELLQLEGSQG